MKFFPKGSWSYAVLLVVLFSLAAVTARWVVDLATERLVLSGYERFAQEVSAAIWLLTMGLMFLAGALGLFGMSATAEYESRHRIARIVSAMNNLSDGLLALDYQGRIRGANPAARRLMPRHFTLGKMMGLGGAFPSLTPEDTRRLLNKTNPCEIEIAIVCSSGLRILRLRSQPAEGLVLVFVSDITEMHTAAVHQHQNAKLQLLGRIAGGVAHDFSNILSAISGNAALMQRFGDDKNSLNESINIIMNETQRGVRLSRQLLALSRSSDLGGRPSSSLVENISEAAELLRVALSSAWKVETETAGNNFPTVPFSPVQIEQIVLNLGLLAADSLRKPGKLTIQLKQPANAPAAGQDLSDDSHDFFHDFRRFAASVMILASAEPAGDLSATRLGVASGEARVASERLRKPGAASAEEEDPGLQIKPSRAQMTATSIADTTGVIPSVVRTLIEEAGGRLDEIYTSSLKIIYRVCLPYAANPDQTVFAAPSQAFKNFPALTGVNILLASEGDKLKWLEKILSDTGGNVERKTSIDSALRVVDSDSKPDLIIAEKSLLGADADSLFKAIRKICPRTGIIIVSRRPEEEKLRQAGGYVFIESNADDETWLNAIVKARQSLTA